VWTTVGWREIEAGMATSPLRLADTVVTCYLLLVVVGLKKLDALNAPLFTPVKSILEHVDRLRHDH